MSKPYMHVSSEKQMFLAIGSHRVELLDSPHMKEKYKDKESEFKVQHRNTAVMVGVTYCMFFSTEVNAAANVRSLIIKQITSPWMGKMNHSHKPFYNTVL